MMEAPANTETTICNKHDILLRRNKNLNNYKLLFQAKNNNINIGNLINFKLYELLGTLNTDIIESIKVVTVHSTTMMDFLMVFKRFGAEVGISKKYMFIRTQRLQHENQTQFISQSIPYNGEIPKGCEQVTGDYANLYIDQKTDHEVTIQYVFNINLNEELPTYMENIIGLLMKKIFYRLKTFIENIK
jgi:hypothetical protein|tara:strand:- start:2162 stop:2725 length:564 start_codon:yes stop_codon:yes gene_type:complete